MKTYTGSLQRRGKRYYLVVHKDGHQRWLALKTDKLSVARMRAARIAPTDPNEDRAWLEQLVREGDRARAQLARLKASEEISWKTLPDRALAAVDATASDDSRTCHEHWISLIVGILRDEQKVVRPGTLTRELARTAVTALGDRYRSAPRIVSFLRRVWTGIGLDPEIWPQRCDIPSSACGGEYYRRMTVEEVRRVHAYLKVRDGATVDAASRRVTEDRSRPYLTRQDAASTWGTRQDAASTLADMVLIGYSTGLRLSDVAELELSELALPFLRIVPNKTRRRKPNPLRIPLTDEALSVVTRLKAAAELKGSSFLFDEFYRRRPSRRIAAAFRRAGIMKVESGRASFHSLRATFISLMDEAGVPPHITDAITGHGGGGMHARYTQPSGEALRTAVLRAIPPLRGKF